MNLLAGDRPYKRIVAGILTLAALIAPLVASAITVEELQASIDEKNKELQEINKKLEETQETLNATQSRGKTLSQEIARIDKNISQVQLNIRSSEVTLDKLGLEIVSLEDQISQRENELTGKRSQLARVLQNVQEKDSESLLTIFLRNQSLSESVAETQAIEDLNNSILLTVSDIHQVKNSLTLTLNEVSGKKKNVEQESQKLKARKEIILDQKEERQVVLTETKNKEQTYQQMVDELEAKQRAFNEEIDEIEEQLRLTLDPDSLPSKRGGVLAYPVTKAVMTQNYGRTAFARRAYKSGFHNGIDFRAPIGTPILAADDGFVKAAGNNGRVQYGKFIVIEHDNNLSTLYAHLSSQKVATGDRVKRGDIIGYSGNTGYSFGPHLHFTLYQAKSVQLKPFSGAGVIPVGITLNPLEYL